MKNEAGLRPMKRAFGSLRSNIALRFTRVKIAEQFASASRRNAPLHVCEANAAHFVFKAVDKKYTPLIERKLEKYLNKFSNKG